MNAVRYAYADGWWSERLKINGRAPRTMAELLTATADYDHRCRLAEIKKMSAHLARLDELLPAIAAAGVTNLHQHQMATGSDGALRIWGADMGKPSGRLYGVLTGIGFKEVDRKPWVWGDLVTLRHGRWLKVQIEVPKATSATNSEGQFPQHVLKAEAAPPDATDRGATVIASPDGGPMGAGQPAAAGPAMGAPV